MSIIDDYTKDFDDWQGTIRDKRDANIAKFPADKFEGYAKVSASLLGSMIVKIPWNELIIGTSIQALLDAGFRETWRSSERNDGNLTIRFYSGDADVTLVVNPDLPNSTCHKIKVGEETKTEDVYEVVCND